MAAIYNAMWSYAARGNRLLDAAASAHEVEHITAQYRIGPLAYLAAFLLAFASAQASLVVTIALAVFFALPASIVGRLRSPASSA
jgi:hypothetical protein